MNLEEIRNQIDQVDNEISLLLEQRLDLVKKILEAKKSLGKAVYDPAREQAVLQAVAERVLNKDYEATIVTTFSDIMKNSRNYQDQKVNL